MGGVAEAWLRCLIGQLEVDTRRLRLSSVVCHPQKLIGEISTGHLRFLFGDHYTSITLRCHFHTEQSGYSTFRVLSFSTTAFYWPTLRDVYLRQTYAGFFVFLFFLCIVIPFFYITKFSQSAIMAIELPT